MENIVKNNPVNNVKPLVQKNYKKMNCTNIITMDASHPKCVASKRVIAGENIKNWQMNFKVKMPAPLLVPNMQSVRFVTECYWVPDSAIWDDARGFYSRKNSYNVPNLSTTIFPMVKLKTGTGETDLYANYFDTEAFKKSWVSSYLPRIYKGYTNATPSTSYLPSISVLKLRGFVNIYNRYLRDKRIQAEIPEIHGSSVTSVEVKNYFGGRYLGDGLSDANQCDLLKRMCPRIKKQSSYLTDYTLELYNKTAVGNSVPTASGTALASYLANSYNDWIERIALYRQNEEDLQLNDFEVISKLGGVTEVQDGVTQFLGRKVFNLNQQSVTQVVGSEDSTSDVYGQLGVQGGYSYTEADIGSILSFKQFKEPGTIHVIGYAVVDNGFYETAIDRLDTKVLYEENYNPSLKDLKDDVLYQYELGLDNTTDSMSAVLGYKRRFSEYTRMMNRISGDFSETGYYALSNNSGPLRTKTPTMPEYTFLEYTGGLKYRLLDYSDIMLNNNLTIPQKEVTFQNPIGSSPTSGETELIISGIDQLFVYSYSEVETELPIDKDILNNFTEWGEV